MSMIYTMLTSLINSSITFSNLTISGTLTVGTFNISAVTINAETLSATKTLVSSSPNYQILQPNGSDRTVNTESSPTTGRYYLIYNSGSAGNVLNVKDSSNTAIITIPNGMGSMIMYTGSAWIAL